MEDSTRIFDANVSEAIAPVSIPHGWRSSVSEWAKKHVTTIWFPWLLALIGFLDYFLFGTLGFVLTPLLTVGLLASSPRHAILLIAWLSAGCFAGSLAFSQLVDWLDVSDRLQDSQQLVFARGLLERHGILAGAVNTVFPLPTIPLIVAAHALQVRVSLILISMSVGRLVRWGIMFITIHSSKTAARSFGYSKVL